MKINILNCIVTPTDKLKWPSGSVAHWPYIVCIQSYVNDVKFLKLKSYHNVYELPSHSLSKY